MIQTLHLETGMCLSM